MSTYPDTLAPGRIDIVIFTSGGKEVIGLLPAYPPIPEIAYLSEVQKFVSTKQGLEHPEKFTGFYTCKDDQITMTWTSYAGEIPQKNEEEGETE